MLVVESEAELHPLIIRLYQLGPNRVDQHMRKLLRFPHISYRDGTPYTFCSDVRPGGGGQ